MQSMLNQLLIQGKAVQMLADDPELVPPTQYSPAWLVLALLLFVVIAIVISLVIKRTYNRALHNAKKTELSDVDALKAEFLRATYEVEAMMNRGEVDSRGAHQELTHLMRRFIRRSTGIDVSMDDLYSLYADPETRELGAAIAWLYEPDFSPDSTTELKESLRRVREAIRAWQ